MVSYTFTLVTTKILKNIVVKFEFFICHAWSKGAKLLSQQVISFGLQVIIHHFLDICNTCGLLDYPNWDSVCISQINPNVIVVRRSYPILKARPSGPKVSKTNPMGPVWVLGLKKRLSTQGIPNRSPMVLTEWLWIEMVYIFNIYIQYILYWYSFGEKWSKRAFGWVEVQNFEAIIRVFQFD